MADLLASVDDLRGVPGLDVDFNDAVVQARALYMLRVATAQVVADIGWSPFLADRSLLVSRPRRTVWLPALNVSAVSLVVPTLFEPVAAASFTAGGRVELGAVYPSVEVRYTAGWALGEMPDALVTACIDLVAGRLENPVGLRSRSWATGSESESVTYATVAGSGPVVDGRLDAYRVVEGVA